MIVAQFSAWTIYPLLFIVLMLIAQSVVTAVAT